jgi:hypothetical protein
MPLNGNPQFTEKTVPNQTRSEFKERPLYGVGQDRSASFRARTASSQASRIRHAPRAQHLDKNSDRVKKQSSDRLTVQAIGWVERPVSLEIDRIAEEYGQTRSHTIATLLKEAVHQRLHVQHAVMLSPLVRKSVAKAIQGLLPLLISIAYDTHQTRHLTGNVLAKAVLPDELDRIRQRTEKKARDSILHQRTQIKDLVEIAKAWFAALDTEEEVDTG